MGRPTLALGTYGRVRTYAYGAGFRARTLYRDWDGVTRPVEKFGKTRGAAENALATALSSRARVDSANIIRPDTELATLAELWFAQLEGKSPSTTQAYRDRLDRQIIPALGNVKVRELTVGLVDRHLAAVKTKNGPSVARMTKSVLSGICRLATRHDALASNPCRDVARISTKPKKQPRSLSVEEVLAIRSWLADDAKAKDWDLPDLVAFMVATGLRIGEACAVCWEDVDLDAGIVSVRGTVLRLRGQGLIIKPSPKSAAGERILELPSWCVEMLRQRSAGSAGEEGSPVSDRLSNGGAHLDRASVIGARRPTSAVVFPAPLSGNLRDPSNTRRWLRQSFASMGVEGVTSHTFRKTVATLMDEAGLSARQAADQLGHAQVGMTQNTYYGRKKRATGAADVLEQLGGPKRTSVILANH